MNTNITIRLEVLLKLLISWNEFEIGRKVNV